MHINERHQCAGLPALPFPSTDAAPSAKRTKLNAQRGIPTKSDMSNEHLSPLSTDGSSHGREGYDARESSSDSRELLWIVSECSDDILRICELLQHSDACRRQGAALQRTARIKRSARRLQSRSRALLYEEFMLYVPNTMAVPASAVGSRGINKTFEAVQTLSRPLDSRPVEHRYEQLQQYLMDIRMELVELQSWKLELNDLLNSARG